MNQAENTKHAEKLKIEYQARLEKERGAGQEMVQSAVLQAKNEGEAKIKERDIEAKEKLANAN